MGKKKRLRRLSARCERSFPRLAKSGYHVTSEATSSYNCIAYAAGDQSKWWEPPGLGFPTYWPEKATKGYSLDALMSAFETLGYRECPDGEREAGYEKVALYADRQGGWTHAAKQCANGSWSSKLGTLEDIQHSTVEAIESPTYGMATKYMRRKLSRSKPTSSE